MDIGFHPRAALAVLLGVSAAVAPMARAVDLHPSAGATAAAFLKIDAGARPAAMAGAYSAVADAADAIAWNPAGLVQVRRREVTAMHAEWLSDVRYEFAAYAHPLGGSRTVAVSGSGVWFTDPFERRTGATEDDVFGFPSKPEGTFQAYAWTAAAAWAQRLTDSLSGGVAVKYVREVIDDAAGGAGAADLGLLIADPGRPFRIALALQNAGTEFRLANRGAPLPLTLRAGGAYTIGGGQPGKRPSAIVAAEASLPRDNFPVLSLGLEIRPVAFAALRAGYRYRWFGADYAGVRGLTAGAGLTFRGVSGDYAFVPGSPALGSTHRISLSVTFGPATPSAPPPGRTPPVSTQDSRP